MVGWIQGFRLQRRARSVLRLWVLCTRSIVLDLSSDSVIQIAAIFGKGFPGWCSFHSSLPESLEINLNLFLLGFVCVSLFKYTHKHKHDSSLGAAIIPPQNHVNRRQPGPSCPQGRGRAPQSLFECFCFREHLTQAIAGSHPPSLRAGRSSRPGREAEWPLPPCTRPSISRKLTLSPRLMCILNVHPLVRVSFLGSRDQTCPSLLEGAHSLDR